MTTNEQDVFMRLSVFRGGFTREAAQAVAGANLRVLMSLTNKSMISRNADNGRYQIHELLRQYADQQLIAHNLEQETHNKHCDYYVAFLETSAVGGFSNKTNELLETEFENVRVTMRYCADFAKADAIIRGHEALDFYLNARGRHQDAISLNEYMIDRLSMVSGKTSIKKAISRLQCDVARFYNAIGQSWKGIEYANTSLEVALPLEDNNTIFNAFHVLHLCYSLLGEFTNQLEIGIEAVQYFEAKDILHSYPGILVIKANAHFNLGNLQEAREVELRIGEIKKSTNASDDARMAMVSDALEDHHQARIYYRNSLRKWKELGNTWGTALTQMVLGHLEVKQNNPKEATFHYQKAFLLEYSRDLLVDMYVIIMHIPAFLAMRGDREQAVQLASFLRHYDAPIKSYTTEPVVRPFLNQTLDRLKSEMGEQAYQQAWDEGKSLTFDQVKQELYDYFTAMEVGNEQKAEGCISLQCKK